MAGTFAVDISNFANKYNIGMGLVVRKITFEAFKRIVLKTPVDTGRARANWGVEIGASSTTYDITASDKSGSATLNKSLNGVSAWDCTGSIFFTNNVPYIGFLEYGSSKKAPQGMVRVTMEEMLAWINKVSA
jgi:hypothetical protein